MNTEKSIRGQRAKDNFNSGYNCSQSVLLAYEDYLQEKGLDPKTVLRMASPMGEESAVFAKYAVPSRLYAY